MASTVKRGSAPASVVAEWNSREHRAGPGSASSVRTAWDTSFTQWLDLRLTRIVLCLAAAQSLLMIALQYRLHANYETYGYDAGLYDQTIWLLGQGPFSSPFLTSRGLPVWGHHVNPILLVLAPLSRLGAGVMFFSAVQVVAAFLGALPVSWLTRAKTGSAKAGLAMALVYLLYPANSFFARTFFHPELLAPLPMLLMGWFAYQQRFGLMWVSAVVAMACREEIAVAVAAFAFVEFLLGSRRRDRKRLGHALVLMIVSAAWFVICSKVIIPAALGGEPFYLGTFYGKYGGSYGEIGRNLLADPSLASGLVTDGNREGFILDLFGPLAFLPVLGLPILMVLPPLMGLLMSSNGQSHSIQSHYSAILIAGLFLSTIEVVRRTWSRRWGQHLLGAVVIASCVASVIRSPAPWALNRHVWTSSETNREALDRAVAMIPDDARVSALGNIVPHLSHRQVIYQFPNPMDRWFYGEFRLEDPAGSDAPIARYPSAVDWLVVDRAGLGRYEVVFDRAVADGTFEVVFEQNDVIVARRTGLSEVSLP